MSLDWLINPYSFSTFKEQHWSRAILRIARHNPTYYDPVFSVAELEQTLYTASRVDKAVEELSEDEVTRPTRGHSGAVSVLKSGRSIRIAGIQRFSIKLAKLSRDLEHLFSSHININMYLSPPSGKKALSRHFDTHDVFVMQLSGRKGWKLFGPPVTNPLETLPLLQRESQRNMKTFRLRTTQIIKNEASSDLTDEFVLEAGDFLYLPRGFWHEAQTESDAVSCHLTVGMTPTTYMDLTSLLLSEIALSEPRLREQLPIGFATHTNATDEVVQTLNSILSTLPEKANVKAALSTLSDIFHRDHKGPLENRLLDPLQPAELEKVNAESWVHVRNGVILGVDESGAAPRLVFGQKQFAIDPTFVEACRFMCVESAFTPSMLPGPLSAEQKIVLVKQLISEDVLFPTSEEKAGGPTVRRVLGPEWIPSNIRLQTGRVRWIQLDQEGLKEPFLVQTVKRRSQEGLSVFRSTPLNALLSIKEDMAPSGFVFHVSRCGSTLLSNGLRCSPGSVVVSESPAISTLLSARSNEQIDRPRLLRGLLRAYGLKRGSQDRSLVFKFTSWNLLYIAELRKLWPEVPCVILIRDPLEVAVSCLANPPGWLKTGVMGLADPVLSAAGLRRGDTHTPESICAQISGAYLKLALIQADELCRIVDYKEINPEGIRDIAQFFNMELSLDTQGVALKEVLGTYSKDPNSKRSFTEDSKSKRASASDLLRSEIEKWAAPFYADALESRSSERLTAVMKS